MTLLLTFLTSTIRLGITLLLGSTGEIITEKSGHLNLGIPGIMCVGAACGCLGESLYTSSLDSYDQMSPLPAVIIPILCSLLGSALMGLIYSFLTVTLRANQNVTGLALTTFGVGVTNYIISQLEFVSFQRGSRFFTAALPFADKLGWFGQLFLSYGFLVYLSLAIAIVASIVLTKTRLGLHLRSVGENPATADAMGINVTLYRYAATCVGSAIAGLGGLFFVMDYLGGNWEYCIDAMGWLSIALVIFAVWKPHVSILGSFLFGGLYIAYNYIGGVTFAQKELLKMLPYVVTILVLIVTSIRNKRENQPPAGLGLNYYREER
ncbi:MAG: ABC transporter permease [Ruminococcaceae bacterium]|nr:ABC transporter permease [Oscillospiraceae bacterium]